MSNNIVIECKNLVKSFDEGSHQVHVIKGVNFTLYRGELAAIVGASGSGKTTLLHLLGGLDTASSGSVSIMGSDYALLNEKQRGDVRNAHLGFVYQFHHLLPEFSALENVAMPLLLRRSVSIKSARERAEAMLSAVALGHRLTHKPSELSGGERQRVAIARALVTEPACVLADEPTGNLDVDTASEIQALITDLNTRLAISFLIVTHDLALANKTRRIMRMNNGFLVEDE